MGQPCRKQPLRQIITAEKSKNYNLYIHDTDFNEGHIH